MGIQIFWKVCPISFLVNLICSLGKMLLPQLLHSFLRHKLDFEKLISLISHP